MRLFELLSRSRCYFCALRESFARLLLFRYFVQRSSSSSASLCRCLCLPVCLSVSLLASPLLLLLFRLAAADLGEHVDLFAELELSFSFSVFVVFVFVVVV